MKVMYLDPPPVKAEVGNLPLLWKIALAFCIIGIVLLGVIYAPWFNGISLAAAGF